MIDEKLAARFDELHWRLDSQRKEIEGLRADKLALMEMLERAKEFIWLSDIDGKAFLGRIDTLLVKMRG